MIGVICSYFHEMCMCTFRYDRMWKGGFRVFKFLNHGRWRSCINILQLKFCISFKTVAWSFWRDILLWFSNFKQYLSNQCSPSEFSSIQLKLKHILYAHHCDIVSSRSSPSHFTKDSPINTSQVRTRSTTKKLNHCLENQKGYYLRNRNTGNAHAAIHLRTINQFLKLVFIYVKNSQSTI